MKPIYKVSTIIALVLFLFSACNQGEVSNVPVENPHETNDPHAPKAATEDFHVVTVNEVLYTSNYVYLNVNEGPEQYWVATNKIEVNTGETYMYKGGLVKINFKSKELDREFDKVYFVNKIVGKNGHLPNELPTETAKQEKSASKDNTVKKSGVSKNDITPLKGSIKIAEIVANPSKYEGKKVQITAKCVKLNQNIMNRNWMHMQDGSANDFDMIVTADKFVPVGFIVTMTATVALNQDFGAGYTYEIILEDGEVIDSSDYQ
jgi:hypothetical protein